MPVFLYTGYFLMQMQDMIIRFNGSLLQQEYFKPIVVLTRLTQKLQDKYLIKDFIGKYMRLNVQMPE